jgi:hypothetical protein
MCVYTQGEETITILGQLQIFSGIPEFQILRYFKWLYLEVSLLRNKAPVEESMTIL